MAEDACDAAKLRERIRRHPGLAMGIGVFLGFAGAPLLLRGAKRALSVTSGVRLLATARSHTLPAWILASLRDVGTPGGQVR